MRQRIFFIWYLPWWPVGSSGRLAATDRGYPFPDVVDVGNIEIENGFEYVCEIVRAGEALFAEAGCIYSAQAVILLTNIPARNMPKNRQRVGER